MRRLGIMAKENRPCPPARLGLIGSGMKRSHLGLFWIVAVLALAADLGSKYGVFTWLYADGPREVEPWAGDFEIRTYVSSAAVMRSVELVPGVFALTATHTGQAEEGDGLLARLRTVSGPN